jgi:hypothetical protein
MSEFAGRVIITWPAQGGTLRWPSAIRLVDADTGEQLVSVLSLTVAGDCNNSEPIVADTTMLVDENGNWLRRGQAVVSDGAGGYCTGQFRWTVAAMHVADTTQPTASEAQPVLDARDGLLARLLQQHSQVARPDPLAFREQWLVQCKACDGNEWRIVQPGDDQVDCQFIREARALGIEV